MAKAREAFSARVARDLIAAIEGAHDLGFEVRFRRGSPLRIEIWRGSFDPIGDIGTLALHSSGDRTEYLAIGVGIDLAVHLGWIGVPFAATYFMNEKAFRAPHLAYGKGAATRGE